MKATLLAALTGLMLSSAPALPEPLQNLQEPPPEALKPHSERDIYLATCQSDLGEIQTFLKGRRALLQSRFYDKNMGMITEIYATTDGSYVMEIGIVATGKACVIHEGFMYRDLRGKPT